MANIQCDSTDNADLKAEDTTKHAEDTAVLCERKESSSELGEEVSDVIRDGLGDVEDNTEQLPGCNDDLQMYAAGLTTQTVRTGRYCVGKLTIIASHNRLSPGRRQAIIWTNAGILLFGPLERNFTEIFIKIHTFLFNKMHLKMSSAKWRQFCLGLNVLINAVDKR